MEVSLVPGHPNPPDTLAQPAESGPQHMATMPLQDPGPIAETGVQNTPAELGEAAAKTSTSADELHSLPIDSAYQWPELPGPANWADLEYLVYSQNQSAASGRARFRYQNQEQSKFRLTYREEPVNQEFPDADPERWLGEVTGEIGPDGLQPRSDGRHDIQQGLANRDLMTALFRFMHVPPGRPGVSGEMRIGSATYRYEVVQLQGLETRSRGTLVTLLVSIQPLAEQAAAVEVWLAVDYRYLPVRIRQIDTQGQITLLSIDRFAIE